MLVSVRLPLRVEPARAAPGASAGGIPARFWVYAGFALLYGVCETVNGNWAQLDMTTDVGASVTAASLALTAFWGMVTVGRVVFAAIQRRFPSRLTYHLLPFVLAGAFVLIAALPDDAPAFGILAFGLAGLGCSALLPLTISFGQSELTSSRQAVAGGVIAFYQVGYGIAAFGVGPLHDAGVGLPTIYAAAAGIAVLLGAWSFAVARRASESRLAPPARRARVISAVGRAVRARARRPARGRRRAGRRASSVHARGPRRPRRLRGRRRCARRDAGSCSSRGRTGSRTAPTSSRAVGISWR